MDKPDDHAHRSRPRRSKARRPRRTPRSPRAPKADPIAFAPVPVKPRHNGWTPARQKGFITELAATGSVVRAASKVRLSVSSAYRLRCRPEAESFRRAWDNALDVAIARVSDAAFDRAINGEAVPHYFQGEKIGEHRRFDTRMAMFLMRHRDFARYADFIPKLIEAMDAELPASRLAEALQRFAALPEDPSACLSATGEGERVSPREHGAPEDAAPQPQTRSDYDMRASPRPPLAGSMLPRAQVRPGTDEIKAELQRRLAAMRIRNSREVADELQAKARASRTAAFRADDGAGLANPASSAPQGQDDPPDNGPQLHDLREL